jgi:hypothetical protein
MSALAIAAALAPVACGADAPGRAITAGRVWHTLSRCPVRFARRSFGSAGAGLRDVLVPADATRARLCVYAGLNPRPRRYGRLLEQHQVINRRVLERAAARLNALPAARPGPSSCPGKPRTPFIVIFGYRRRPPVTVTVYLENTCFLVGNGHKLADASSASAEPVLRLLRDHR